MEESTLETLVQFFRALANEERLKIVGLLANDGQTSEELAATLGLRQQALARHLSALTHIGLLAEERAGPGVRYTLDVKALERMSRQVLAPMKQAEQTAQGADEDATKTLRAFFKGDRLQSIPTNHGKRRVVLAWLADRFEPDRRYPESEVNQLLQRHFDDHASLRRYLVDEGFLMRERGVYWRVPGTEL